MNVILCLYIFAAMVFVYVLLTFHIMLLAKNITTNEFCKDSYETIANNPFAK